MSNLETEFPNGVVCKNVEANADTKALVQELGFKTHGLAIHSSEGKVLWTQADHEVKIDEVRLALKKLTR